MMLLLDSALRSLLFGLLVAAVLKLLRLRDLRTETVIWSAVLIVSLMMPLRNHLLPQLALPVPGLTGVQPQAVAAEHLAGAGRASPTLAALSRYVRPGLLGVYALGLLICLTRVAIGLLMTLRVLVRAAPVAAIWAQGRQVRSSTALKSPASLAWVILLPADYLDWSATKRNAVLAHEQAHIARGDFFVQLAASIHCALFWFSPFAWWLRSKLGEIAETASDEAAVRCLNDRVTYAEILLEVARGAQPTNLAVAMAKGPFIQQRLDRILCEAHSQTPARPLQVLVIGSLTLAALTLASANAAIAPNPPAAVAEHLLPVAANANRSTVSQPHTADPAVLQHRKRAVHPAAHVSETPAVAQARDDQASYNPRALLDPVYALNRRFVATSTIVHGGNTIFVHSSERPVAEVSTIDGIYRQAH